MSLPADAPSVEELFSQAEQIYVGVLLGGRPHVTPELVATSDGRLWCFTAAVTKKVEVVKNDDRVGFLAMTSADSAVAGLGRATIVDAASPSTLTDVPLVAQSAVGAAKFVTRNAAELAGAAIDALTGKLGRPLPPRRVVMSIEPTALARLEGGHVETWGEWSPGPRPAPSADARGGGANLDTAAPEDLRDLLLDGDAACGVLTRDGSCAVLPAAWIKEDCVARVDGRLFRVAGVSDASPVAITRDQWTNLGPTGKQGLMLRGPATAATNEAMVDLHVSVERVVYWDGVDTGSAPVEG
jgi:hypothetical protein